MGPHTLLLPAGALRAGENVLLLKVSGWAGIAKGKVGYPLIPTGSGTQGWGHKDAAIYDDIWLDFYDRVYMRHALAMPDLAKGEVTFRIWLDGAEPLPEQIELSAEVRPCESKGLAGEGKTRARAARPFTDLPVPLKDAKPWTPRERNLYEARLSARVGGSRCDEVRFRFGMRQVGTSKGRYRLNGSPLWLRGSNLVFEWQWGGRQGEFNRRVKEYLVDEARAMNLNSFRTHTLPPPAKWLNVCDEHGTMILAELPVLYNYANFRFTAEELEIFHKNALVDAAGWVRKLWNHPSVVIWVLSNESRYDNEWESDEFYKHVRGLDPTRPCLRSGGPGGTPDTFDVHTCGNYGGPAEGGPIQQFAALTAEKDPNRPLSNTEYMNLFARSENYSLRWLGREDDPAERLNFAEFAAEHTEAMRRLRFDGVFPYMYAGWTRLRGNNWRADYPTPMAAALHSCMTPVLASLDLFDRNFLAGKEVATRTVLINELHEHAPAALDVYVTAKNPLFVPDADALEAAVSHQSLELHLKADSFAEKTIRWKMPEVEGVYYLAAVLRREGDKPVISQRTVRAIDPKVTAGGLNKRNVVIIGATAAAEGWLKGHEIPFAAWDGKGKLAGEVAVVWDAGRVSDAARANAAAIRRFVSAGGRLVILNQRGWEWKELADFELRQEVSSRAFPHVRARHAMLAGVNPEFLKRFNGLPGTVADRVITGEALKDATKLLWIVRPEYTVAAALPAGQGEIVICTLNLKSRIHKAQPNYDPAAERILLNLIAR
ncbi:MAG: hypothetical protein AMJ81_13315 [Phycisphaerae bacterium SM23_33]|nr:MAG: hypothetical protein AMJ81_13315 [Phycisphaerae bacterium SM23_33]